MTPPGRHYACAGLPLTFDRASSRGAKGDHHHAKQSPAFGEDTVASAMLEMALEVHPAHLNVDEAIRQLAFGSSDLADQDAIRNAIHDLAGDGLLHRHGDFIFASRAAVRFNELSL